MPEARKALASKDPLSLIEDKHLSVKTKAGELRTLVLNKPQQHILNIIRKLIEDLKPIRLFILKARQVGVSTLIEAVIYSMTSQRSNVSSLIVADDVDGSNYLFEMSKLYQETCPEYLRPMEKKSNAKALEFDAIHSQILIDTAQNKNVGRKYTFQYVHISEYAFFPYPQELMLGLSQAVPSLPGTMIIKETTANGYNFAKEDWDQAVNRENDYVPIFVPWYWLDEYKMAVVNEFVLGDPAFGEISKAEFELKETFEKEGIDYIEERLMWRRWCIKNNCANKVINFQQEYPSTPEEAFIASGDCAFDKEQLVKQLKHAPKPIAVGNIVKVDHDYKFRPYNDGDFKFWKKVQPRSEEEYVIGGDACSGSGTDYAWLVARGKKSNSVVATFRAKCDADVLAEKAELLASFLHNAEVAIENDKYGFHANLKLKAIYGNVYSQETIHSDEKTITTKFGWETNSKTRPAMLGEMKEEIRQGAIDLNDPILIRECLTFIKNPESKKEEAQEGCNDDGVMACAISGAVRQMHPFQSIRRDNPIPKKVIPDY